MKELGQFVLFRNTIQSSLENCANSKPSAAFTVSGTIRGCGSFTTTFNDKTWGQNITSRTWDFGDGATSTDIKPTHTYTAPGVYSVKLTATNSFGTDIITKTNFISLGAGVDYASEFVGPKAPGTSATGGYSNAGRVVNFEVFQDLTLVSMVVQTEAVDEITLVYGNGFDEPLVLSDPDPDPDPDSQKDIRVEVAGQPFPIQIGYTFSPGKYHLRLPYSKGDENSPNNFKFWRETSGITYPQKIDGLISIVSHALSLTNADAKNAWYIGYNWEVKRAACSPVGIEEHKSPNGLVVYPNPSEGVFNVLLGDESKDIRKIEVYNIIGAKVYSLENIDAIQSKIDLNHLAPGTYILKAIGPQERNVKIMIQ